MGIYGTLSKSNNEAFYILTEMVVTRENMKFQLSGVSFPFAPAWRSTDKGQTDTVKMPWNILLSQLPTEDFYNGLGKKE